MMEGIMQELAKLEQEEPVSYAAKAMRLILKRREQRQIDYAQACEALEAVCLHLWEVLP